MQGIADTLLATWLKNKNGAVDSDIGIRRVAIQTLSQDLYAVVKQVGSTPWPAQNAPSAGPPDSPTSFLEELMTLLMEDLAKVFFRGLADPAEACR